MKEIPLIGKHGGVALVDDWRFAMVQPYRWLAVSSGRTVYARRSWREDGKQRTQFMHNLIMGRTGIDHRDHNGLNNQEYNLRAADQTRNSANQRKAEGCSSRFKGVGWYSRHGLWQVGIAVGGKRHHLGYFTDEIEAALAYDAAARDAWGEFAHCNFPEDQ